MALFFAAMASILRAPGAALRVVLLPSLLRLALEIWIETRLDPEAMGATVAAFAADVALVAVIAVGWHRFSLLGERPGWRGGRPEPGRLAGYGVEWVVLGLFVGILMLLAALPVLLLEVCCLPAGTLMSVLAMDGLYVGYFTWPTLSLYAVGIWIFGWLFFRLAIGLPHLAVRKTRDARLASWALTKPLEPGIFICAGLAMIGTLILWAPSVFAFDLFPENMIFQAELPDDSVEPYRFSIGYLTVLQVLFTVQILCGAAILTEIYRRVRPAPKAMTEA